LTITTIEEDPSKQFGTIETMKDAQEVLNKLRDSTLEAFKNWEKQYSRDRPI